MITNYDIDKKLYKLFKQAVESNVIPITGDVYNGDRPLNSTGEDITIRTMSVGGDGFPQNALTNVNCYVSDIAEDHGGFVRNGARLDQLSEAIVGFVDTLNIPYTSTFVENIVEIDEPNIRQHYLNVRMRTDVYNKFV